jgi:hypothetical protein
LLYAQLMRKQWLSLGALCVALSGCVGIMPGSDSDDGEEPSGSGGGAGVPTGESGAAGSSATAAGGGSAGDGAGAGGDGAGGTAGTGTDPDPDPDPDPAFGAPEDVPVYDVELHVDGNNGSDSNPGTAASPVKTIQQGLKLANANNQKQIATRVNIAAGMYRESLALMYGGNNTAAPLGIEAAQTGTVVVTGADSWTGGWVPSTSKPGVVTRHWPHDYGLCAVNPSWDATMIREIVRRREIVFVDGKRMTQVLSLGQMRPGTFHVDESADKISLWPPPGKDPNLVPVEIGARDRLVELGGTLNVRLRGLVVQHGNGCAIQQNAVHLHSNKNLRVEEMLIQDNNSVGGGHAYGEAITFRNLVSTRNGGNGLGGFKVKNALWNEIELSHNGWRTAQGAFYGWDSAGMKIAANHGALLKSFRAHSNMARGLWHDYDNRDITINGLSSYANLRGGYWSEANQGPITVKNSLFCRNNLRAEPFSAGFEISNSHAVRLDGSRLFDNGVAQIFIGGGQNDGRPVGDWETGEQHTLFWDQIALSNNIVAASGAQRVIRTYMGTGSTWNRFVADLESDQNVWWNPDDSKPFEVDWNKLHDLSGWQSLTGRDAASSFAPPGAAAMTCPSPTTTPDFWLFVRDKTQQTVTKGQSVTFFVRVRPVGGFDQSVSLAADGMSQIGASGAFASSSVAGDQEVALTVTTSSSTAAGLHELTVIASGNGITRTVVVSLLVS